MIPLEQGKGRVLSLQGLLQVCNGRLVYMVRLRVRETMVGAAVHDEAPPGTLSIRQPLSYA